MDGDENKNEEKAESENTVLITIQNCRLELREAQEKYQEALRSLNTEMKSQMEGFHHLKEHIDKKTLEMNRRMDDVQIIIQTVLGGGDIASLVAGIAETSNNNPEDRKTTNEIDNVLHSCATICDMVVNDKCEGVIEKIDKALEVLDGDKSRH